MKNSIIILLLFITFISCEKTKIIIPEKTLFIYDAISNYRSEINYKFIENGYTRTNKTMFFNYESQIKGWAMYNSCDTINQISEKIAYLIPKINYCTVILELNENLIIEQLDSVWNEPISQIDTNIWILKKGVGMYSDKYFLIVE